MKKLCSLSCMAALVTWCWLCASLTRSNAKVPAARALYIVFGVEFTKKEQNPLEHAISVLFDVGLNGYTGFLVGNGLVMTAYHVISGNLSTTKKVMLGFKANDELSRQSLRRRLPCESNQVDKEADLALLEMCRNSKSAKAPSSKLRRTKTTNCF